MNVDILDQFATNETGRNLWAQLYTPTSSGHELALLVKSLTTAFTIPYTALALVFLYFDRTPNTFLSKYKNQPTVNVPVDKKRVQKVFMQMGLNSIYMFVCLIPLCKLMQYRGIQVTPELPSLTEVAIHFSLCVLSYEVAFYYAHRLFHVPALYRRFHKKHHEWTAPIGLAAGYAHPVESILGNQLPILAGPLVFAPHLLSIIIYILFIMILTVSDHSGYNLPYWLSSKFHDLHHEKFNGNYGAFGILDNLHGTAIERKRKKHS